MDLFNLQTQAKLSLGTKVNPNRFRDVVPTGSKELDLENPIVDHPFLLNLSDVSDANAVSELLIIGRQPHTQTRKRADLFVVADDGALVIIEIKRDAEDERNRSEGIEFQAIRYEAASRRMDAKRIIDMFADYLQMAAPNSANVAGLDPRSYFRNQAIAMMCEHLADEDPVDQSDLEKLLDPRSKQRIYLVAAGFDADVLSACAWLREHKIDIYCFRLRPYDIAGQKLLERGRLIPPPELLDFLMDMRPSRDADFGTEGTEQTVATWKEALVESMTKAMTLGLNPADLPMRQSADENELRQGFLLKPGLYIETHGAASTFRDWISKALSKMGKENGYLQIVTRSGQSIDLPYS